MFTHLNIYEFEIYYDVDAPALQNLGLFTENEDGGWEEFSADTWINAETKDVYLRFTVTDDITDVVTSGLEKVTVTGNGNNFETEITLTPGILLSIASCSIGSCVGPSSPTAIES